MVKLEEFPGMMVGGHRFEGNTLHLKLKREAVTFGYLKNHDYNLHFHFCLRNEENDDKRIRVLVDCDDPDELDKPLKYIWISPEEAGEYRMGEIEGRMGSKGRYYFEVVIKGHSKLYLANFYPIPFKKLEKDLRSLPGKLGCMEKSIGRSVEGREIFAYEFGDIEKKPCLMFLSGYHPPENDPIFLIAIMEMLSDPKFKRKVLERYSLSFLPLVNPDGFVHRMQGSNVNEKNFHWNFFDNSEKECPECYHIWNYCKKVKPVFYMDFHAFTFQNNQARPYIIPPYLYSSRISRKIQKNINIEFSKICGTPLNTFNQYITSEKILAPNILATGLRKEIGTITSPKFHLHMKDGVDKCREMSRETFLKIISIMDDNNVRNNLILNYPYGKVKRNIFRNIFIKVMIFSHLKLKYYLNRSHH